jgi:hypothetical protein
MTSRKITLQIGDRVYNGVPWPESPSGSEYDSDTSPLGTTPSVSSFENESEAGTVPDLVNENATGSNTDAGSSDEKFEGFDENDCLARNWEDEVEIISVIRPKILWQIDETAIFFSYGEKNKNLKTWNDEVETISEIRPETIWFTDETAIFFTGVAIITK